MRFSLHGDNSGTRYISASLDTYSYVRGTMKLRSSSGLSSQVSRAMALMTGHMFSSDDAQVSASIATLLAESIWYSKAFVDNENATSMQR